MKITDRVYALDSTKGSYVYIILGKETILIDTGLSFKRKWMLKELESMNIKLQDIKHILLTHYDLDHIGNAAMLAKLTGATLWASEVDRPCILGEKHRPGFKKYLPYILPVEKPREISPFSQDGKFGDITVIPSPGHTPGHVCLLFEEMLFVGDLVENQKGTLIPYPSFWNWNTPVLKETIKKMAHYPFQWVCPAHGKPIERGDLWERI